MFTLTNFNINLKYTNIKYVKLQALFNFKYSLRTCG